MSSQPATKKQKLTDYKSKNYFRSNKKQFLEAGQRGFLATCNFREKDCVRECYNILNQYADELYGPQQPPKADATSSTADSATVEESTDIVDDLQKEIDAATAACGNKQKGKDFVKQRFQVVDTGTTNCVFIKTTLDDPVQLGTRIVSDIASKREQKTRFLLRLVPIEAVCRANIDEIVKAGGQLFDRYFLKQSCTFSIVFNKRYNNDVKRDDVIRALAEVVHSKNVHNKVDLKHASKSVVVEVIKGLCCMSVVDEYLQYKKYNLLELANPKVEEKPLEPKSDDQKQNVDVASEENSLETIVVEKKSEAAGNE